MKLLRSLDEVRLAAPLGSPYAGPTAVDLRNLHDVPESILRVSDSFSLINLVGGMGYARAVVTFQVLA